MQLQKMTTEQLNRQLSRLSHDALELECLRRLESTSVERARELQGVLDEIYFDIARIRAILAERRASEAAAIGQSELPF